MGILKDAYYPLGCGEELSEGEFAEAWEDLSEHAQDARDFDYEGALQESTEALESFLDGPFPGDWVTRDGRILRIREMTIGHLDNAISYFDREGMGEHPKIDELREERKRR